MSKNGEMRIAQMLLKVTIKEVKDSRRRKMERMIDLVGLVSVKPVAAQPK